MVKAKNQAHITVDKITVAPSTAVQAIIAEKLYDLQGRPAYSTDVAVKGKRNNTKPAYPNQIGFEAGFINERNPAVTSAGDFWTIPGGTMDGNITSWVDPNIYSDTDNQSHAYSGRYYENDPTSRTNITSAPGMPFQGDTPQAPRYAYGQYDTLPGADAGYSPPPQSSDITGILNVALSDPDIQSKNAYQTMVTRIPLRTLSSDDTRTPPALYQISMTEIAGDAGFNLSIDNHNNFLLSNTQYQVTSWGPSGNHIVRKVQHNFPNYYDNRISIDQNNFQMQTEIDALGRTTYSKGPDDQGSRVYYDSGGLLRFSQNADQAQAMTCLYYVYDGMGRLSQISGIPLSAWDIDTFEDYLALPNEVIPDSVLLRRYTYDNPFESYFVSGNNTLGRLVQVDSWNCAMNLSSNKGDNDYYQKSQVSEIYNYDSRGRLSQCQLYYMDQSSANNGPQNVDNFKYAYNNLSQVTQIAGSTDDSYTVNYQYNLQGLLSNVSDASSPTNTYVEYVYNADGTLNNSTMPLTGYQTSYSYNTIKQLTSLNTTDTNNNLLFNETLSYLDSDSLYIDGNITSAQSSYGSSVNGVSSFEYNYTYDSFKRLASSIASSADGSTSVMPSWQIAGAGYDSNGNILGFMITENSQTETGYTENIGGTNQISSLVINSEVYSSYDYTPSGRVSVINPNPTMSATSVQNLEFTYDILLGRPISISSESSNTTIIYDATGERIYKSTDAMSIQYYRHGSQVLYEQLSYYGDESTNFIANYYYGLSGIVGGTYKMSGNTGLSTYSSIVDHLGSTRLIIDPNSAAITYFNYDTWGNLVTSVEGQGGNSSTGAGQESPALYAGVTRYLYTGQEWDAETELYNYHARQYDPSSYRFLTPDPMYQYTNPYTYVANNPVNFVDPDGKIILVATEDLANMNDIVLWVNIDAAVNALKSELSTIDKTIVTMSEIATHNIIKGDIMYVIGHGYSGTAHAPAGSIKSSGRINGYHESYVTPKYEIIAKDGLPDKNGVEIKFKIINMEPSESDVIRVLKQNPGISSENITQIRMLVCNPDSAIGEMKKELGINDFTKGIDGLNYTHIKTGTFAFTEFTEKNQVVETATKLKKFLEDFSIKNKLPGASTVESLAGIIDARYIRNESNSLYLNTKLDELVGKTISAEYVASSLSKSTETGYKMINNLFKSAQEEGFGEMFSSVAKIAD